MNRSKVYKDSGIFFLWGLVLIVSMNQFPNISESLAAIAKESLAHKTILLSFAILCFSTGIEFVFLRTGAEREDTHFYRYMIHPVAKLFFSFASAYLGLIVAGILVGVFARDIAYILPKAKVLVGLVLIIELTRVLVTITLSHQRLENSDFRWIGVGLSLVCCPLVIGFALQ